MGINVHTLACGARVISLSAHGFRFSDGTECTGQQRELVDFFTLKRVYKKLQPIAGMSVNAMQMVLSEDQLLKLSELCGMADVVILPFPVLQALREQGVRANFLNAVAFNATEETQRASPQDKIVDINNWSY